MAKDICPSCGAPYNGKKCRICYFQPLNTDMIPSTGTRRFERPFVDVSKRKSISRKKRCAYKKQKTTTGSLVGFLIILVLIALMLPVFRNLGTKLEAIEASQIVSESLQPTIKNR